MLGRSADKIPDAARGSARPLEVTASAAATTSGQTSPDELYSLLEQQLRAIASRHMRHEANGHVLQTTALINEAYLRLSSRRMAGWTTRSGFLAAAAEAIRRILIEHARAARAEKRGGDARRVSLAGEALEPTQGPIDVLELDDALKQLACIAPRQARGVELRFFAGLSEADIAEQLGVSRRTVQSDWRLARAWLRRALSSGNTDTGLREAL